ncbi:bifunctional diguanylate cyclase/phosphodiesterase [Aliidiomarina taiwanensis]|uniref:Bifunctional diguanylate cyclase/phosphodiesterase n=1 Tax=Aliidiomarina taiwanensis TaxID=946228 RepID=A0A432WZC3_9GAMM|nr:bifunctional diguanylate cyclase/phosphodiesterase [Aliidiomarina taiwanensis]RUO39067.1 bifunctional diguanylate cyclase/phosphodiesterase [Aliidiomarina taiwanensis]
MSVLPFVTEFHDLSLAYQGHHKPWLVALSLFMAILAAFASMFHTDIMRAAKSTAQRNFWHLSGSVAMGLGIWAMHFIGMVSYRIDVPIFYTPTLTAISVIPAVLAAWVTLAILYRRINSWWSTIGGGVLMGAGIGTMHYTGMAAMETVAEMRYVPNWFFASIVVAIVMAVLALAIRSVLKPYIQHRRLRISLSAVVMGLAVASMHYTAMHATVFFPNTNASSIAVSGASSSDLVMSTLIVAMFIVVISTVVVVLINKQKSLEQTAEQRGQKVQELTDRLHRIADRVPGMVYQLSRDEHGVLSFNYISSASKQLFGVAPEDALENPSVILQLVPAQQRLAIFESLNKSAFNLTPWKYEFPVELEPGSRKWLAATAQVQREQDGVVSWSGFISDVTDKKTNEETIQRLAFYDSLTHLPNRRMIVRELNERIAGTLVSAQGVLLWNINLDNFKRINDVHGQEQGDELLKAAAKRIQGCLMNDMLLGRLTADEFIIVTSIPSNQQEDEVAESLTQCILGALSAPYKLPKLRQQGTASIGFVSSYDNEVSAEELLRRSDLAVHQAKRQGGNKWLKYHEGIEQEVSELFALESDLREAIGTEELQLYYQLQVNDKHEYIGAEALTRWIHPERGLVSPGVFIPIAEESGLIIPIGEWVIRTACLQLAAWEKHEETKHISISVNVSARQFYQDNFVDLVLAEVEQAGINPKMLMLELTESLVLEDMELVVEQMYALKKHGIRFSMDDFGTGYSSLSYLSTLPFDEVKIDQAFIRRAASPEHVKDWSIVEAIIGITKKLHMDVIAEGVETTAQQERLLASGCTRYQGYLFSKPSPISKLPLPR